MLSGPNPFADDYVPLTPNCGSLMPNRAATTAFFGGVSGTKDITGDAVPFSWLGPSSSSEPIDPMAILLVAGEILRHPSNLGCFNTGASSLSVSVLYQAARRANPSRPKKTTVCTIAREHKCSARKARMAYPTAQTISKGLLCI